MADYDETLEKKIQQELTKKAAQLRVRHKQTWNAQFGMIASLGGVVIVPILLGIWSGGWLDEHFPQRFSWKLSLLFLGAVWGFINAYFWVKNEDAKIARNEQQVTQAINKESEK